MKTIHKFQMKHWYPDASVIEIPLNAKFLHFAEQYGSFYAWFELDTEDFTVKRRFSVIGTGANMGTEPMTHLGTLLQQGTMFGTMVWHLYEIMGE